MALHHIECITCKARNCSILERCGMQILYSINENKHAGTLAKGEHLFMEGDPVKGIYFIKKGFLKIEVKCNLDRPLVIKFTGKGTIFGHEGTRDNPFHPRTVTALSKVSYCFIPLDRFNTIAAKNPILKQHIFDQILLELRQAEQKALTIAYKSVREKVADTLLAIAEIYDYAEKRKSFRISFSRADIAELIGTTKEQVSKILNDFGNENVIRFKARKFSFLDLNRLQAISENIPPI